MVRWRALAGDRKRSRFWRKLFAYHFKRTKKYLLHGSSFDLFEPCGYFICRIEKELLHFTVGGTVLCFILCDSLGILLSLYFAFTSILCSIGSANYRSAKHIYQKEQCVQKNSFHLQQYQ